MGRLKTTDIDRDIASIVDCEDGHPIEAIERLVAAGARALPRVHEALAAPEDDSGRDLVSLTVILGEARSPASLPALAALLRKPACGEILMDAASEALGKFGAPAIPILLELLAERDARTRFWALGALRRMRSPLAVPHLRSSLKTMPDICGVAAAGLAALGDKDSIPDLYALYEKFPSTNIWLPDLRDSIACLAGQLSFPVDSPRDGDWRTRWRRRPGWGWSPEPSALMISYVIWDSYVSGRWKERRLPKDSLLKITTTPDLDRHEPENEVCPRCGDKILSVAAVPVCPELAYGSTVYQENLLLQCRKDGITTITAALDDLDQELLYGDREWDDLPAGRRDRWLLAQRTYEFLLLEGRREVNGGIALLREIRSTLGARWGLPQEELVNDDLLAMEQFVESGLGLPKNPAERRAMKTGRNEPCPCGSGKKFKKCCAEREQ